MVRIGAWLAVSVWLTCTLAACSGQKELSCEDPARYAEASSSPPVQIPDDLSPPNETDALRLPPDAAADPRVQTQPCLESPPAFFGEGRANRTGRPEAAETPAEPDATSEAESTPAEERVIEN